MAEPTPGPWFTGNAPSHSAKVYARRPGDNVRQVANCEQHDWIERSAAENRANARLIAAAPELLAACQLALSRLDRDNARNADAFHALYAAVAKATGA